MKKYFFEFHVSKEARTKYKIEETLFAFTGDLIIANFQQARVLAQKINDQRKKENLLNRNVTAGQINALGIIHEIFHYAIRYYEDNENPGVFNRNISYLKEKFGNEELNKVLTKFTEQFPPLPVYKGTITAEDYLIGTTGNKSNKEIILEEIILLHLENLNPAFTNLHELYDDNILAENTVYEKLIIETDFFFSTEKPFGLENLPLLKSLKKPILENPDNALNQLNYIKNNWFPILDERLILKIIGSSDLFREEAKAFEHHGGGGRPTPPVPTYKFKNAGGAEAFGIDFFKDNKIPEATSTGYLFESERFTEDIDWMPNVVMIAKNTYVWLDQLSKKYGRHISKLDHIPNEELDLLASWNFTALWLIGIWERSAASQKIKQYMGNIDAAPSAYSLFDYEIANDLGGEPAFQNLKERAWQRGIRIASDMVPNHTGIFSKWIIEHPEYFIQSDYPPYPNYSFSGINLSEDPRIQLRIEDRYYSKTDAAVVFQRIDNITGKIIYIYHGNDGTNMPWNDTAQLNLLKPEVREALIQTIMKVARKSPIIRFDAAMTLAKKHYQRLWFPLPGTGGAIPSRSDFSMSAETFDSVMPVEFWREVVDRINAEMPNTLLLAEAFWLMEGYFVRTLGMHRVYNSAFMHMFMKEENDKFRALIKNTLEFNPEILKRYVNFMSNPDEETAINQFGKGDKYFGVSVMMVTIPGLPMFGHGQVEGLTEKYGMEYRRAYYNEVSDEYLINRHKEEIFPLIKKRDLFSQVENFEFYDFIDDEGNINENVMSFSNFTNREKTLVFYNNSYSTISGTINYSCNKITNTNSEIPLFANKKLIAALKFNPNEGHYYTFRDNKTKMEYIISGRQLNESGFRIKLQGYQYYIFIDFREHFDTDGSLKGLDEHLNGAGVPSIQRIFIELKMFNLHNSIKELLSYNTLQEFQNSLENYNPNERDFVSGYLKSKINNVLSEIKKISDISFNDSEIVDRIELTLFTTYNVIRQEKESDFDLTDEFKFIKEYFKPDQENHNTKFLFSFIILKCTLDLFEDKSTENKKRQFENYLLEAPILHAFDSFNHSYMNSQSELVLLKILLFYRNIFRNTIQTDKPKGESNKKKPDNSNLIISKLIALLDEDLVKQYIDVNTYNNIDYFGKEAFEKLLNWLFIVSVIKDVIELKHGQLKPDENTVMTQINERFDILNALHHKAETAEYKIKTFIELLV